MFSTLTYKITTNIIDFQPDIDYNTTYNTVCEIQNAVVQDYTYNSVFSQACLRYNFIANYYLDIRQRRY